MLWVKGINKKNIPESERDLLWKLAIARNETAPGNYTDTEIRYASRAAQEFEFILKSDNIRYQRFIKDAEQEAKQGLLPDDKMAYKLMSHLQPKSLHYILSDKHLMLLEVLALNNGEYNAETVPDVLMMAKDKGLRKHAKDYVKGEGHEAVVQQIIGSEAHISALKELIEHEKKNQIKK